MANFSPMFPDMTGAITPVTKPVGMKQAARYLVNTKTRRELAAELNGAAAGDAALVATTQVGVDPDAAAGSPSTPSGSIPMETYTLLSRVTAAADVTELAAFLYAHTVSQDNYPADGAGNPHGQPGMR